MRRRLPPDMPHPRCQATHFTLLDVAPPVATPADTQQPADYDDYLPATVPADRLVLKPGDTLVVRLPSWAGEYDVDRTRDRAREQLPAAIGVVVVKGDELAVIRPDTRHMVVERRDPIAHLAGYFAVERDADGNPTSLTPLAEVEPEWPAPPAGTKWSDFDIRDVPGSSFDTAEPPVHYYFQPLGEPEVACGGRLDSPDGWYSRTTPYPNLVTCDACAARVGRGVNDGPDADR